MGGTGPRYRGQVKDWPGACVQSVHNEKAEEKWQESRLYDLLFVVSDGSVPMMLAKKNILHFQVPFKNIDGKSLLNQIKLKKIHCVVCNSFLRSSRFLMLPLKANA